MSLVSSTSAALGEPVFDNPAYWDLFSGSELALLLWIWQRANLLTGWNAQLFGQVDMVNLLRSAPVVLAMLIFAALPRTSSVRQIDFKNFAYPWEGAGGPLEDWHWISSIPSTKVKLSEGVHQFCKDVEAGTPCNRAPGLRMV